MILRLIIYLKLKYFDDANKIDLDVEKNNENVYQFILK